MNVYNDKISRSFDSNADLWSDLDVSQRELMTKHEFLIMAYAMAIIIMAMGLVMLIMLLATLTFFYPDKGGPFVNTCILLLGGPMATLLVVNGKTVADLMRSIWKISQGGKHNGMVEK